MTDTSEARTYTATEARERFADVFDAAWSGQVVIVTKRGRRVAFVPLSLLERLDEAEQEAQGRRG